jgi:GntR family transcriptional regulator / MocR family aminotransferase
VQSPEADPDAEATVYLQLDGYGPSYAQLVRALKSAISDGSVAPGERLPPTRTLAQELGVSRTTVVTAYEQLETEGCIYSLVGSGSYVTEQQGANEQRIACSTAPKVTSRYAFRAAQARSASVARMHFDGRYDLQCGNPITNASLSTAWGRELARAAVYTPPQAADAQGTPALREQVARYLMHSRGIQVSAEQVLIVHGFQQAVTLAARVLVDEGDLVVMEDPRYFLAQQALTAHGARVLSVPTDVDGLITSALPEQAPRLLYVTPSHQYPTGSVMSLQRRRELLRYAEDKQSWILEDDYDGDFRYESKPLAALRTLDHADRVIYAGTFSKIMFSSLRLGYMVLPSSLVDDFINAKFLCDFSTSAIEQAALAHFMESGGFARHLMRASKTLKSRRDELIDGLRRYTGERLQLAASHAGMHLVAWMPNYSYAQCHELIDLAMERGVGLYPIAPYYQTPPPVPGLLLGYCSLPPADLRHAMQLLGECLDVIDAKAAAA